MSKLRAFLKDTSGNFAAITAVAMVPLLAGVALVVDYSDAVREAAELQDSLDSALVEIAVKAPTGYSKDQLETMGRDYFVSNFGIDPAQAANLFYLGVETGSKGSLVFTARATATHASLFNEKFDLDLQRWSQVERSGGDAACVLALNGTASRAIEMTGNTTVDLDGCILAANSTASNSINRSGNAKVTAECAQTVGQTSGLSGNGSSLDCGSPRENSFKTFDPLSGVVAPSTSGGKSVKTTKVSGQDTLSPGVYNSNTWTLNNKEDVLLTAGTYVFDGTAIKVNANATLKGTGVTIFLMNGATFTSNGQAVIDLSAPTTGTYKGILFYVDPDESVTLKINGGSTSKLQGYLYNPGGSIEYAGNGSVSAPECVRVVADTVTLTGTSVFKSSCDSELGGLDTYTIANIRFVR